MKEVLNFFKDNPVFYIATVDGNLPKVRPIAFYMEHEGKLYFGLGDHKPSYKQLKANPNFEICVNSADNKWIRLKAKAVFDGRPEVLEKALEVMPMLKNLYTGAPESPKLGLFYAENAEAVFADMAGHSSVVKF